MDLLYIIYGSFKKKKKKKNPTKIRRVVPEKLSRATSTCLFFSTPDYFLCNINFFLDTIFFSCNTIFLRMVCLGNIFLLPRSNKRKSFLCSKKINFFFCASQIFYLQFLCCTLAACCSSSKWSSKQRNIHFFMTYLLDILRQLLRAALEKSCCYYLSLIFEEHL